MQQHSSCRRLAADKSMMVELFTATRIPCKLCPCSHKAVQPLQGYQMWELAVGAAALAGWLKLASSWRGSQSAFGAQFPRVDDGAGCGGGAMPFCRF